MLMWGVPGSLRGGITPREYRREIPVDPWGFQMWERTAARNTRTVGIRSILPLVLVVFVLALIGWFTR